MALTVLNTKLFVPRITDRHVARTALLKKLADGYNADRQLSLVSAPAGYGKTTVVLEFLNEVRDPYGWVSLDEGDNDPGRFLAYLSAALKNAGVTIGNDIDYLVTEAGFDKTETVLTILLNAITACPGKIILVLDDYHVIRSAHINDIMKFILGHQPPNLHVLIISREDPQLPLARMRMKGSLNEIRMGDLVFSDKESAELFSKTMELRIDGDSARRINTRAEGWIAGLQLAGIMLKNCEASRVDDYIRRFDGTNGYIIDYLVEEVLSQQPPELKDFLCKTSILERMNAALCVEITGKPDSREILQGIEKANLFLIPLDDRHEWYRYHHLFADSLRANLPVDEERELNKNAAIWMKRSGFSHEAVEYAFRSKDMDLAVRMVEDSTEEMFKFAQLDSLVRWIERIPDEMVMKSEVLSVRRVIAYLIVGKFGEALEHMKSLQGEFENNASPHNKGLIFYLRATIAAAAGQDAETLAVEALKLLEPWDPIARTSSLNVLGRAQYLKGKISDATETFRKAYESGLKLGHQFVTTLVLMNYASCLRAGGRREEALALCQDYIRGMKEQFGSLPPYVGIIYVTMAETYDDAGQAEQAQWHRDEGTALCKSISYDAGASLKLFSEAKCAASPEEMKDETREESTGEKGKVLLEYGEKLSERETEILKLLAAGFSNQDVGRELFISLNTVQWHISHIYSKLGVKSRTQAILKARESGMI